MQLFIVRWDHLDKILLIAIWGIHGWSSFTILYQAMEPLYDCCTRGEQYFHVSQSLLGQTRDWWRSKEWRLWCFHCMYFLGDAAIERLILYLLAHIGVLEASHVWICSSQCHCSCTQTYRERTKWWDHWNQPCQEHRRLTWYALDHSHHWEYENVDKGWI